MAAMKEEIRSQQSGCRSRFQAYVDNTLNDFARQNEKCEKRVRSTQAAAQVAAVLPSVEVLDKIVRYESQVGAAVVPDHGTVGTAVAGTAERGRVGIPSRRGTREALNGERFLPNKPILANFFRWHKLFNISLLQLKKLLVHDPDNGSRTKPYRTQNERLLRYSKPAIRDRVRPRFAPLPRRSVVLLTESAK